MKRLKAAFQKRPILTGGFVLAVIFTALFAIRTTVFMVYWANPDHRDREIEPWMTPRFVARSWQLPPEVMVQALAIDNMPSPNTSLAKIAEERGVPFDRLRQDILAAAIRFRDENK